MGSKGLSDKTVVRMPITPPYSFLKEREAEAAAKGKENRTERESVCVFADAQR